MKQTISALLLALASLSATAGEYYVLGSYGLSMHSLDTSTLDSKFSKFIAAYASSVDENTTGLQLKLGYQFNPNFAIEGGYADLGKSRYSAAFTGGNVSAPAKVTGYTLSALGIVPLNERFSMFGKFGFINAKANVNATGTAGTSGLGNESATKLKANYGIGGIFNASKNIGVRVELEQFNNLGDSNTTNFDVNLLSAGIAYKF